MARRKELRYMTIGLQDGFSGTGAVNDATLSATDTVMGVDTLSLVDNLTIVPKGVRFTTAGIATVRTITGTQNSQEWSLDLGGATGGTFDLILNGETAAGITVPTTSSAIQSALEGLASMAVGDVAVVDGPPDDHVITMSTSTATGYAGNFRNLSTNTLTFVDNTTGGTGLVLNVVQDGTTTWEITFSPAIVAGSVPADDDVITWLPQRIVAKIGEGNLEHTENDDPIFDTDRGLLDGVRLGVDQPMEVSLSFVYQYLRASSGDPITIYEALRQLGDASTWVTTATDPCEPYCVDVFAFDRPPCGSDQAEAIFFRRFYKQSLSTDTEAAQVSLSGQCNATAPDISRVANTDDALGALV